MSLSRRVSVVGLGYVGLPVAVAFGKLAHVVGFDINQGRVDELARGLDRTGEVHTDALREADIKYTTNPSDLQTPDFHIVAVPTPVTAAKNPDLLPVLKASETVGRILKKGDIVVYESTVYPGVTEDECVPVLERFSGLRCGVDFKVGYSPERINPGDKVHTFTDIVKVVSGQDAETLDIVASVYASVVRAGVHRAPTIKVAEAPKVIENIQRDVNIALVNELAQIFHRMGIETADVLAATRTKWNALPFTPGLVGGHCIGVDPYYLTHEATKIGYTPQLILTARRINDQIGTYVASEVIKQMVLQGTTVKGAIVTVLGLTFKENVPDLRNSRVVDIIAELESFGCNVQVHDPMADPHEAFEEYGVRLLPLGDLRPAHAVVFAVPHRTLTEGGWATVTSLLRDQHSVVADVKSALAGDVPAAVTVWRL